MDRLAPHISPDNTHLIARLRQHVDRLAGSIGPRHLGKPAALAAAAELIEREFSEMGFQVQRQDYAVAGVETLARNLIVEIAGSDLAGQIVVLGAHYDSTPTTPGADDNASAVAVLLEVARLMQGVKPRRTVRFVAFACEELPYFNSGEMGSQVYAHDCRQRNERIVGLLCLEMVGYFRTEPGSQRVPPKIPKLFHRLFPQRGNFLAAVGNLRSWRLLWSFSRGFRRAVIFPLFSIGLPELIHDIRRSDNSSFWDQGYSALMLTDTSYLRNPNYHQATDTPDTLDYSRMAQVTRGVLGGLLAVAKAKPTA